jgi:ankyrin repeat protein
MTARRSAALMLVAALSMTPVQARPPSQKCEALAGRIAQSPAAARDRLTQEALFEAAALDCPAIAAEMLARGASVEARNRRGATALSIAAGSGAREIATLLLDAGADLQHRDLNRATPLLIAAREGRRRMAGLLLEAGADVNAADRQGVTPLMAAAFDGDARLLRLLLDAGARVDARDTQGKGAIVYAAGRAYPQIVSALLDAGADADGAWGHELTPLMWAAGHANDAPAADGVAVAGILLDAGAELQRRDDRGRTALMIAAQRGHREMVTFLLGRGADPTLRDKAGLSAADLAPDDAVRALLRD